MLSIENLSFAYKKSKPLLSSLNLELKSGNVYGLFGLNGAGKTTLLNIITGMLFPKSGLCLLDGQEMMSRDPHILSQLYIVPEQFDLPNLTGDKFIELHHPFYPKFDKDLIHSILTEFEIDASNKLPELSFGQRKKFLIAFSIATNTKLLILDEPTNGLDIPSKSQFRRIVASLDIDSRCIIISTHQVRDLGSMIDHITVLKDGSIVFDHATDEITDRLSMQKIAKSASTHYIYGEETLGGVNAIVPSSKNDGAADIDLELLFNGIIQKTEEIEHEFNGERS
jgi:ABC-2 type transport system ATP-binding protein